MDFSRSSPGPLFAGVAEMPPNLRCHLLRGDAEVLEQLLLRAGGTVATHAHEAAVLAKIAVPAQTHRQSP